MPGSETLKKGTVFVLVAGGIALLTYGTLRLAKLDAFANLKAGPEAQKLAFTLSKVKVTHYHWDGSEERLVTRVFVDRVDVLKDQQNFQLFGVRDGIYRGEIDPNTGKPTEVKFTAQTAQWNAPRKRLEVTSGAHIVNADFDLRVPKFQFDAFRSRLTVPGRIEGKLGGGDIKAVGFAYNTKTRNWEVGETKWHGPLSLLQEDGSKTSRELWQVNGKHLSSHNGIRTYTDGYAENTNGETIVTAKTVEQNPKTHVITCTGKVFYYSTKANMTCDKAVIYEDEKRAVLTGSVNMIIKPKNSQDKAKVEEIPPFQPMVPDAVAQARPPAPPPGEDQDPLQNSKSIRKYPASVLADKIEYWYKKGTRHALITGSPQAFQAFPEGRWRRIWTHDGYYDAEAETLKLNSDSGKHDTRLRDSIGNDLTASDFIVSTKDDENIEDYDGDDIAGKVYNDNQNQDSGTGSKPPPGFERALNIPRMPTPSSDFGGGPSGLHGQIGGTMPKSDKPKPRTKPKQQHKPAHG